MGKEPFHAAHALLWLSLAAGTAVITSSARADESLGRALVEQNCAGCHATGPAGTSPHPDAPPFRTLSQLYPLEQLEEALAEGIVTGHPDMPEFIATPEQIEAILAYIGSLSAP
jgi:cytochrome c